MLDTLTEEAAGLAPAATVSVPAQAKSVVQAYAIVGSNPATVMAAPYGDPSWSILACSPDNTPFGHNKNCRELPRVDETYELHIPVCDESRPFSYVYHIATTRPVVWLRDERALASGFFKGGRLYPEKELKGTSKFETIKVPSGKFKQVTDQTGKTGFAEWIEERPVEVPNRDGKFNPYMFTSSIAYMIAHAIDQAERNPAIKTIGLWGIMQQSENEFTYQKPGIQYFLDEARERGIKIVANRESCLFDMPNWKW